MTGVPVRHYGLKVEHFRNRETHTIPCPGSQRMKCMAVSMSDRIRGFSVEWQPQLRNFPSKQADSQDVSYMLLVVD